MKVLYLRVPVDIYDAFARSADALGVSLNAAGVSAITEWTMP